jgi:hypothetical protein
VGSLSTLRQLTAHCEGPWLEPSIGPEPSIAVGEAWQAYTTLREHRGDGHVAALEGQGLNGRAPSAGIEMDGDVEAMTDHLAERVLALLSDEEMASLHTALLRCAGQIQASGVFPFPNPDPMGLPAL